MARFIRSKEEHDVAEAAIAVVDDMQNRGVGHALLMALAEAARERGIKRFRADVLASNTPMRHLLEEAGARVLDGEAERNRRRGGRSAERDAPRQRAHARPARDARATTALVHR